jgi:hypothetical protein
MVDLWLVFGSAWQGQVIPTHWPIYGIGSVLKMSLLRKPNGGLCADVRRG